MSIRCGRPTTSCGTLRLARAALCLGLASPAIAQIQASPVPAPESQAAAPAQDGVFVGERSRDVLAAQVILDRARFSPGAIDGYGGGNTARAVATWQRANGMEPNGRVDAALLAAMGLGGQEPVLMQHTVADADLAGPFGALPAGMEAMAELEAAHYETAPEGLAERFHMSQALLRAMNPDIDRAVVGTTITVAAVRADPIDGIVARIEVDGAAASLRAFAADGRLLANYPVTVGSADFPSPSGPMAVRVVAPAPAYYFSPEGRDWGPDKRLTIAPGPNNPVGSTWIDLTQDGYGIHGTPDPRLIGKTASHGCVRLTNWDAAELAKAVEPGTEVVFL